MKTDNRELKGVGNFEYFRSVLTRDGYCTRKIKRRIDIALKGINRKLSFSTSKLNNLTQEETVNCYVCSIALYCSETWTVI